MDIVVLVVFAVSNIACFVIGAKVGQKVVKGERIDLPSPTKAIREHKEQKKADAKRDRMETIVQNIDMYDGTSAGQKDVGR
jgi:hypothetical protein